MLVDYARTRKRLKRGPDVSLIPLDEVEEWLTDREAAEVISLDEALDNMSAWDARAAQVVEMRFFGGLSLEETADVLDVSAKTVQRTWIAARAWLRKEIGLRALALTVIDVDPERWGVVEAFTGAVERTVGHERERYLAGILGDYPPLLDEVHAMLRAHEALAPLEIEKRLLSPNAESDLTGTLIGAYRLVRLIAKGGMGEVYEAERKGASFRQQVAVKVLRQGLAGPEALLSFRQERQILARLVHPGIVALLDGGVTAEGRPYLVMQYVDGKPVTTFCDERGWVSTRSPEARICSMNRD